jgi:hypothetical protein
MRRFGMVQRKLMSLGFGPIALLWTVALVTMLPIAGEYRVPPGTVNGVWYLCLVLAGGLVACSLYACRFERLRGRLFLFAITGVAVIVLGFLLTIWYDISVETYHRMRG